LEAQLATLLVFAPALAGAWPLLLRRGGRLAVGGAVAGSVASLVLAGVLLANAERGVAEAFAWAPELGVTLSWRLETATLAIAALVAAIGALVLQYTGSYFSDPAKAARVAALLALFESAMLGLALSDNLFALFAFWELTGICSFFLISVDAAQRDDAFPAARQAFLVTSGGALSMLVGFVYLLIETGTASLGELTAAELSPVVGTVALALILPGVLTKSAQVPFHFWLPGAMAAPSPISAYLHSATMVKAGVILLIYLYPILGGSPLWTACLVPLGALTALWGSYRALGEDDVKLLMAWSTVSQLGLLTLTLGLGTDLALRAAVLHLFAHAIFKAGLFLSVGAIDQSAGTRSLTELGGLGRRAGWLFAASAVLAGSMAGIPPLAGFLSKELILKKAMLADPLVHVPAIAAIVLASIGTVAYSSRFAFETFTGEPRGEKVAAARLPGWGLLAAPALLALMSLASGLGARWVDLFFLEPVTGSLLGGMLEFKPLSLWYGINAALILSVVIVTLGYGCDRLLGLRFLPRQPLGREGARYFEGFLDSSQRIGGWVSHQLAGRSPALYFALVLTLGVFASWLLVGAVDISFEAHGGGFAVVGLLALSLAALFAVESRLAQVLFVSAAGFAVAILFRLMSAPDLLLTQLLVEVLTTVFLVLALRWVPRREVAVDFPRLPRAALALGVGVALAVLVFAVAGARAPSAVKEGYVAAAPELAKGLNVVNVILTDFRSLDTFIETLVVVIAALGVVALVRGREMPRRGEAAPFERGESISFLLSVTAPLLILLAVFLGTSLLLEGHDEPGGGFVGGLSFAIAAVLALVAGRGAFESRWRAEGIAVAGVLVILATALVPFLLGQPALTHAHGSFELAGTKLKWHTVLLFDVGVVMAVAGGVAAAARALWRRPEGEEGGER